MSMQSVWISGQYDGVEYDRVETRRTKEIKSIDELTVAIWDAATPVSNSRYGVEDVTAWGESPSPTPSPATPPTPPTPSPTPSPTPPTPAPTPYPTPAPPTPAPTPAGTGWTLFPTPAPTPQPTAATGSAVVVITTKLTGFTPLTFTLGVQMSYRSTIAAKVATTVDKVTLVNIRAGSRRLGEQPVAAAAAAVHFDTSISVASTAAATAMKSTVAAVTPAEIKDKFVDELKTEKESGKFPVDEFPASIVALAASITVTDPVPSAGTTVTASPTPAPATPAPPSGGGLGGGALAAVLLVCLAGGAAGMFALQRRRSFSRDHESVPSVTSADDSTEDGVELGELGEHVEAVTNPLTPTPEDGPSAATAATGANPAYDDDDQSERERSTTNHALDAREDPEGLIGQSIDVEGKGAGKVVGVKKVKGKSTQHMVAFGNTPGAKPELVLLQKRDKAGKGLKFWLLPAE